MVTPTSSVSIGALLRSRPEVLGLPLELVAGASGLDKRITSPHIQKTGLALAGFDAYLSAGRILILGESEVRYLESLALRGAQRGAAADVRARHPGRHDHRRVHAAAANW